MGCEQKITNPITKPAKASVPAPIVRSFSEAEKKEIIDEATKNLDVEYDKMEGMSFYSAYQGILPVGERITAYISRSDSGNLFLRVYIRYYGDDWIFFNRVKVMSDEVVVYEHSFEYSDVHRHNSSGSVWEIADFAADSADILALRKIAMSKQSTIRLSGDSNRDDHELLPNEINRIDQILTAYDQLVKLNGR